MDLPAESCAQLCENVSDTPNTFVTHEIEDLFYDDHDKCDVKFFPPAYIQRYNAVVDVLSSPKYQGRVRKVVDFGCSELGFFTHLKNIPEIEEILCVDIDEPTLEQHKKKIDALTVDFLHMRDRPLTANIFKGSVTDRDKHLENTDALIAIELIEHLYDETLFMVPNNIFGYIKPQVAIITTPNADFNVLFPRMQGFRHPDHKFEWTRKQFQDWAYGIIKKYPEYEVTFDGIGKGPEGTEYLGCCSQMAVFHRSTRLVIKMPGIEGLFKLIAQEKYPVRTDNRSDETKILDEAVYFMRSYQINHDVDEMPLKKLANIMENKHVDLLKETLQNGGWQIVENEEEGPLIICRPLSAMSEYDQSDDEIDHWNDNYDYNYDSNYEAFDGNFDTTSEMDIDLNEENFENDVTELVSRPVIDSLPGLSCDSIFDESETINRESLNDSNNQSTNYHNSSEIKSMCSIFLETSQNENSLVCPENITDPNFALLSTANDSIQTEGDYDESSISVAIEPQLTSTPQKEFSVFTNSIATVVANGSPSCSLEIVDSGYPYTSSSNDLPKSDLPSIALDSDCGSFGVESPGVDFLLDTEIQRDLQNIRNKDSLVRTAENLYIDTVNIEVLEDNVINENIH